MSIKGYGILKLNESDFNSDFLYNLKINCEKISQDLFNKINANLITVFLDHYYLKLDNIINHDLSFSKILDDRIKTHTDKDTNYFYSADSKYSVLFRFFNLVYASYLQVQEKSNSRDPEFDISCKYNIYKVKNKDYILVDLVSEFSEYKNDLVNNNKNLSDYSYWNNTDKPDEISNKEWKKRAEDYDNLTLIVNSSASKNVYCYEYNYDNIVLNMKNKNIADRVKYFSSDILFNEYCKIKDIKSTLNTNNIVSFISECRRYFEANKTEKDNILNKIKQSIEGNKIYNAITSQ